MKLNTAPTNQAIMGNISETGEFRIRNSSKAFEILSSGLYANKIRAIVRELSCNAWDSHVAAGNTDKPFDLHLPTQLEPYFSIRDYGTGLTHDQVVNIYTTYFESTKTDSNDFIGALGLGSKSPFSYTENFTVTAIRDGVKGVYTAFINHNGIPSVARMADVETDEPNGVEVKFSVENTNDFYKFADEARTVLTYFKVKPSFTGNLVDVYEPEYSEVNIVENINVFNGVYRGRGGYSVAVMGNIAYPINIPNPENNIGNLSNLLDKGLEINFNIGEVEFQASREGLSYTKFTIESIRKKLELLQSKLDGILFSQADAIDNTWERSLFLVNKNNIDIWRGSVYNYVSKNKDFGGVTKAYYGGIRTKEYLIDPVELEKNYNLAIKAFRITRGDDACYSITESNEYINGNYVKRIKFDISDDTYFVKYAKTRGGIAHCKYHFKKNRISVLGNNYNGSIYILSPVNKEIDAKYDEFFKLIDNPPEKLIYDIGDLDEKPKVIRENDREKNVSILYISTDIYRNSTTWKDGSKLNSYDNTKTYYYMPLSGYTPISKDGYYETDAKELWNQLRETSLDKILGIDVLYGVRKADIDVILEKKNWVNIQDYIIDKLSSMNSEILIPAVMHNTISNDFKYIISDITKKLDSNSEFYKFFTSIELNNIIGNFNVKIFKELHKKYANNNNGGDIYEAARKKLVDFTDKYPLINNVRCDYRDKQKVIEQLVQVINMVEQHQGV